MEESLHDVSVLREFADLDNWSLCLHDRSTILRSRHLWEKRKLESQILATVNDPLSRQAGAVLFSGR